MDKMTTGEIAKNFSRIERVVLPSPMAYESVDEVYDMFKNRYPDSERHLIEKKDEFYKYFEDVLEKYGRIVVPVEGEFWHCFK